MWTKLRCRDSRSGRTGGLQQHEAGRKWLIWLLRVLKLLLRGLELLLRVLKLLPRVVIGALHSARNSL